MIVNHTRTLRVVKTESCITLLSEKGYEMLCFTHEKKDLQNVYTLIFTTINYLGEQFQSIIQTDDMEQITISHEEPIAGIHLLGISLGTTKTFVSNDFEINSEDRENSKIILGFFKDVKDLTEETGGIFNFNYKEWLDKVLHIK